MACVLAFALASLAAFPVLARCQGSNQIAALPPETRATLRAAVDAAPFAQGNLWRATRGDQVLHLIGTYHLDDPRHDAVMARLAPLLDQTATLLVEAGPAEEAALLKAINEDPSMIFVMDGPTLPEVLPPETWLKLQRALTARSVPVMLGAKMQPAYLSILLAIPPCAVTDLTGVQNGLDKRLVNQAEARGVPVQALEPYDVVFGIFAILSENDPLGLLQMSLAMEDQSEDLFATLADSYFAEDSRMIWEFSRWWTLQTPGMDPAEVEADFALMEDTLVIQRNRAWIPVIEAALDKGPVLAAFGALHLSGEDGVLALLERAGFTVERLEL